MRVGCGDADGVIFMKDGVRRGSLLGRHGLMVTGQSQPGLVRVPVSRRLAEEMRGHQVA